MKTFNEWLKENYNVSWSYWDNNYSPQEQDRIYEEWEEWKRTHQPSIRDLIVEEIKNYNYDEDLKPLLEMAREPKKYQTLEFWKKTYINSILCQREDEKILNMSQKEYEKLEQKVFELCENDEDLWHSIDFNISKNIEKALD